MTRRAPTLAMIAMIAMPVGTIGGCAEGLPEVPLKLSKNCNEVEVRPLAPVVGAGPDEIVLDIATNSGDSDTAWLLVRRPSPGGDDQLVLQLAGAAGIERELPLDVPAAVSSALTLHSAPVAGQVWLAHEAPGIFELFRITPDDPLRPVLGSEDMSDFPADGPLCEPPCDSSAWPRRLMFLSGQPVVVSLPTFSVDAGLIVWVAQLDTDGAEIRTAGEHRLNFEPPCLDDPSPEAQTFCDEQRTSLRYPEVTLLGVQQDPRLERSVLFAHRTRAQTYADEEFPLESADVFMVSVFLGASGIPEGILRSYSGFYSPDFEGGQNPTVDPLPSAQPPFGIAVDRFAAYGLFSNDGVLPRIIQLPSIDPDFVELTGRIPLAVDSQLLQIDRDLMLGRFVDGRWDLLKVFPDDPAQSTPTSYESDAPLEALISGGQGIFLLEKQGSPPELVRAGCPTRDDDDPPAGE